MIFYFFNLSRFKSKKFIVSIIHIVIFCKMISLSWLKKLEKELNLRNYSFMTIKAYKNCIEYFLKKLDKDIIKI